ncbi:winged helix-turn-helix transcriptional regulator [Siphonobacter aquaeclarae]|uniref:winged helix-turn-helix transcriptional regulator n=1 Tax=Siphonobacter aquaeclarae TaxID=563176 RepID=UPI001C40A2E6|nr:helix-turn-helix domain-containing protein [Siphonobacter aquaeclarae]
MAAETTTFQDTTVVKNKHKQGQLRDVQDVIDIIGGRWRGAILASLCDREKRFNDLRRDVGEITPRILIKELKYLELNKLIGRNEEAPTKVSYYMTPHGKSLEPLIGAIVAWGRKHREVILSEPLEVTP